MSSLLDASVVVRYLVGDSPEQADAAARLIDAGEGLILTGVTIMEVGFVLTRTYGIPRSKVVDLLVDLLASEHVQTIPRNKSTVIEAISMCRDSGRVSFADAMLWVIATADDERVFTFDRRFPTNGIEVVVPS